MLHTVWGMKRILTLASVVGLGLLAACGSDDATSSEAAVATEAPDDQSNTPAEAPDGLVSVAKSGFSTFEAVGEIRATMGALIQSNADQDLVEVQVTYDFVGSDGTSVATETSTIAFLPAGEAVANSAQTMTDLTNSMPVTVEVTASADEDAGFGFEWAELEVIVADPVIAVDDDDFFSGFSGTVTNTTDITSEYNEVTCLVIAADGSVLGGATGFADTIEPGETATWNAQGIDDFVPFAEADASVSNCRTFIVVG